MGAYEEHESTVWQADGTLFRSKDASALAEAVRKVLDALTPPRVCVCRDADRVAEPLGSTCYRCSGRVTPRAPFRVEDWT